MLAERFLINMFLKMTYYPGLAKIFMGGFVFHGTYFDCNIISGSIFLKLGLNIILDY